MYGQALIPQPLLPEGEGEQDFKVPLPEGEGFRVRADKGDILPSAIAFLLSTIVLLPLHRSFNRAVIPQNVLDNGLIVLQESNNEHPAGYTNTMLQSLIHHLDKLHVQYLN